MSQGTVNAETERAGYRWLHVLNVMLLVGLWVFTIIAYPRLPEQIPAHIGPSGVTRWTDRDSGMWWLLPILTTFQAGVMYLLSRLADSGASGMNVPQKKRVLTLPKEAQIYVLEPARAFMYGMATWLILLMGVIQVHMYMSARAGGVAVGGMLPVILMFSAAPLLGVWWLSRAIGRRIDAWESGQDVYS